MVSPLEVKGECHAMDVFIRPVWYGELEYFVGSLNCQFRGLSSQKTDNGNELFVTVDRRIPGLLLLCLSIHTILLLGHQGYCRSITNHPAFLSIDDSGDRFVLLIPTKGGRPVTTKRPINRFLYAVCFFGVVAALWLLAVFFRSDQSQIVAFLHSLKYKPHPNYCGTITVPPSYYHLFYYKWLGLSLVISILIYTVMKKSLKGPAIASIILINCFLLVFGCHWYQTKLHWDYLKLRMQHTAGQSTEQRYQFWLKDCYTYIRFFREVFPVRTSAQVISDLNLRQEPGIFYFRQLAYHLYPVDIRGFHDERIDYLLLYQKEAAAHHIPADFEIIAILNESNLIAARKEVYASLASDR
jgi:hypothetical protein